MEKVYGEVHYYDCKGRQYRLDYLADDLRGMGIEVNGTDFNDDYDGYVEVLVTREQAVMLDNKYHNDFNIIGRGKTIDEIFDDALRIDRMVNEMFN